MSHIVKNKEDLILLKDKFDIMRKEKEISVNLLEDIVVSLIPKNNDGELYLGYDLRNVGALISSFSFSDNEVRLSVDEMTRFNNRNCIKFIDRFGIRDIDLFKDYMFLMIILHEIEHGYQYLMAYGVEPVPCKLISDGYRLIIDTLLGRGYENLGFIKNIKNDLSHFLYYKNCSKYVIERNANVEAFDLLQKLAISNDHYELSVVFNQIRNAMAMWGYMDNNKGSFDETCRKMLIGNEYRDFDHSYELSDIDSFRYGLPISDEFREKIRVIKKNR